MSASPRNDAKLCNISDFVHCYAWQKRSEGLFIATVGTGCIENGVILCVCGASVLLHAIPKRSTAVAAIIESIVGCNSFFVITRVPVRIPSSQTPERKKNVRANFISCGEGAMAHAPAQTSVFQNRLRLLRVLVATAWFVTSDVMRKTLVGGWKIMMLTFLRIILHRPVLVILKERILS